mgnify:CR=1 FL=1
MPEFSHPLPIGPIGPAGRHEVLEADAEATAVIDFNQRDIAVVQARADGFVRRVYDRAPGDVIAGSGMHPHQSLGTLTSGTNAFIDTADAYGLSKVAKHFLAGQLAHIRGMTAVLNPLVNSYRRLVPGYEAPVYISWARQNRSALIRVPAVRAGRTAATRIELRCPDPACNPYLAYASMLAAGIDGIENEMDLPEPVEENLYHFTEADLERRNVKTLPSTLGEAVAELARDEVIKEALGEHVFERLTEAQRQEWSAFCQHVTAWERERYLEVY